jgi:Ring finger domain
MTELEQYQTASSSSSRSEVPCAICLEDLDTDTSTLSCGHSYHILCILPWLVQSNEQCPTCRQVTLIQSLPITDALFKTYCLLYLKKDVYTKLFFHHQAAILWFSLFSFGCFVFLTAILLISMCDVQCMLKTYLIYVWIMVYFMFSTRFFGMLFRIVNRNDYRVWRRSYYDQFELHIDIVDAIWMSIGATFSCIVFYFHSVCDTSKTGSMLPITLTIVIFPIVLFLLHHIAIFFATLHYCKNTGITYKDHIIASLRGNNILSR